LLKRAAKVFKVDHLIKQEDDLAEEINRFSSILDGNENLIFGHATYLLNKNKNTNSRKPHNLPLEEDIRLIKLYIMTILKEVEDAFFVIDSTKYVELRDAVCSRLTLLNGRRGKYIFQLDFSTITWEIPGRLKKRIQNCSLNMSKNFNFFNFLYCYIMFGLC